MFRFFESASKLQTFSGSVEFKDLIVMIIQP